MSPPRALDGANSVSAAAGVESLETIVRCPNTSKRAQMGTTARSPRHSHLTHGPGRPWRSRCRPSVNVAGAADIALHFYVLARFPCNEALTGNVIVPR